jgi:hypothetical protein
MTTALARPAPLPGPLPWLLLVAGLICLQPGLAPAKRLMLGCQHQYPPEDICPHYDTASPTRYHGTLASTSPMQSGTLELIAATDHFVATDKPNYEEGDQYRCAAPIMGTIRIADGRSFEVSGSIAFQIISGKVPFGYVFELVASEESPFGLIPQGTTDLKHVDGSLTGWSGTFTLAAD